MDDKSVERSSLYSLEFPAPQVTDHEGTGPVLVHALNGFADAGHAVALAAQHLRDALDSELVATFSSDELIDYRSRRPTISFNGDTFTDVEMPSLTMHAIRDTAGRPFLLLAGSEPDLRWEQFVEAVRGLAERFGVTDVIGLNAIPMAVPHTRPPSITAHGSEPERLGDLPRWGSAMKLPASASMLLELRMSEHDYRAAGLSVHVPHYLSQADYPAASARLLDAVGELTGLELPITALDNAAAKVRTQIDAEVSGNAEIESVVTALEAQYDTFTQAQEERASLLAAESDLPSGEELGAELEKFLAEQMRDGGEDDDRFGTGPFGGPDEPGGPPSPM
ncbi:PAC2 family protein [Gordonia sp. OPL2]|uniref:PAC2 family protein n=1 Tax=Gordonia sp. OPL2 TaxID=2486274 RepID=UPI0016565B37|nr:PAC2 family protein [Gordonia sp. OPL2]RPA19584.1 PAC2 family protein [Gordonia sp. OPL2]